MKVIGLLPIRNEAWVLRQTLESLSGFCDVVLVHDQASDDASREICRQFSKVELLESSTPEVCERARFRLLDAARDYNGVNLLWITDADELVSPVRFTHFLDESQTSLRSGAVLECMFYQLWNEPRSYRNDLTLYRPDWKSMGFVDDRLTDYDRTEALPLHRPRVPIAPAPMMVRAPNVPVVHLQWLVVRRNQMKQAWYRCREWIHGEKTAAEINALYSITLLPRRVKTSPVPPDWVEGITFPDFSIDAEPTWHEREILEWFDERGAAFFEPLEIWHIPTLRSRFEHTMGRRPRADRSYVAPWTVRAQKRTLGALRSAKERLLGERTGAASSERPS